MRQRRRVRIERPVQRPTWHREVTVTVGRGRGRRRSSTPGVIPTSREPESSRGVPTCGGEAWLVGGLTTAGRPGQPSGRRPSGTRFAPKMAEWSFAWVSWFVLKKLSCLMKEN